MFRKSLYLAGALTGALLWSVAAQAAPGAATGNVNMRSGPGTAYPVIAQVPAGAALDIGTCSNWCEVNYGGRMGYVSANYVSASSGPSANAYAYYDDYYPSYDDYYDYPYSDGYFDDDGSFFFGHGFHGHGFGGGFGHHGGGFGGGYGGHGGGFGGGHGGGFGGGFGGGHGGGGFGGGGGGHGGGGGGGGHGGR